MEYYISLAVSIPAAFLLLVCYAHLPFGAIRALYKTNVPYHIKQEGKKQFYRSAIKQYMILPFDLLSPIVVPFLLLFTSTSANRLKFFDNIWGNDVSINGDLRNPETGVLYVIQNDTSNQQEIDLCYWAKGHHPRSFYARWIWLGLRNRASMMNVMFGKEVITGAGANSGFEFWSSNGSQWITASDRWEWLVRKVNDANGNPVISIMSLEPVGNFYVRRYYGHKIPVIYAEWNKALIAIVGWSIRKGSKLCKTNIN